MGRDTLVNFILVAGFILLVSLFNTTEINSTPKEQNINLKQEQKTAPLEERVESSLR
jgi:hypothetical protein